MEKVGVLGPRGTHSEAAAIRLNEILSVPRELVICADIDEVFAAVESGELDAGFVPVENSLEGGVNVTLDLLARTNSLIVAREFVWTVHNHLMVKAGTKYFRTVNQFHNAEISCAKISPPLKSSSRQALHAPLKLLPNRKFLTATRQSARTGRGN